MKEDTEVPEISTSDDQEISQLQNKISDLENDVKKWKTKHADTVKYAEKLLAQLKGKR